MTRHVPEIAATILLGALGDYLAASSLSGEQAAIANHEAEAEEDERRLAELRELREAHPPLAS